MIKAEDLRDGLRVLYLTEGLFYEGAVRDIQPPDVYVTLQLNLLSFKQSLQTTALGRKSV